MAAIGRILLIVVVFVVGAAVGAYFLVPAKASKSASFSVDRPAQAVFGYLSNAPAGAQLATGVTQTKIVSAADNKVVSDVKFADGTTGQAIFVVTPKGDKSEVQMTLEQALGPNPLERVDAITGGKIAPLFATASTEVTADIAKNLPPGDPVGLPYELTNVTAKPFIYNENCSPQDPGDIKEAVAQSLTGLAPFLVRYHLTQDGPPLAVETGWDEAKKTYCFEIGYAFTGKAPTKLYFGGVKVGQTPGGDAVKVHYTGTEEQVIPTYDKMESLIGAARLTRGVSFEVYNDNPSQSDVGSTNRDIYYMVSGDTAALARVAPASAAAPPAAASSAAPAAPASSAAPASAAPAAPASSAAPAAAPAG